MKFPEKAEAPSVHDWVQAAARAWLAFPFLQGVYMSLLRLKKGAATFSTSISIPAMALYLLLLSLWQIFLVPEYSSPLHVQFSSALQHVPLQDPSDSKTCSPNLSTRLDSWSRPQGPSPKLQTCNPVAYVPPTLGHLRIPISKIQLLIFPESCFSPQITHLHSPGCLGKKI